LWCPRRALRRRGEAERRSAAAIRDVGQVLLGPGDVKRIRPKFMTVATMFLGLGPILISTGASSGVMKRIAAPMVGGIFTSFLLELVVYPPLYEIRLGRRKVAARFEVVRDSELAAEFRGA